MSNTERSYILALNLAEERPLEIPSKYRCFIVRAILEKCGMKVWTGFICLERESSGCSS
jgi:hypothetical protein